MRNLFLISARYSRFASLITMLFVACLPACSEKEFDPNDPKKSFGFAKEPYDEEHYDMAITKLGEFKSRFPYSQYAVEAELLIANSHFELEHFAEAAVSYEQFVKLHPKHPQVDFAMYRVGDSYWKEAPEDIDREQDYTHKAVMEWEKLVLKMPDSEYGKKAAVLVAQGKRRLAEHAEFVAKFYCKMEIPHACAYRYIKLIRSFGEFPDLKRRALEAASKALDEVAADKIVNPESDKNLFVKKYSAEGIQAQAGELRRQLSELK